MFSFQIGRKMQSPYVKFVTHTGLYFCFLSLVFIATSRQGSGSPWLDIACKGIVSSLPDSIVYIAILIFVIGECPVVLQKTRYIYNATILCHTLICYVVSYMLCCTNMIQHSVTSLCYTHWLHNYITMLYDTRQIHGIVT